MEQYAIKIVTPDGCIYDGEAQFLACRTIGGDVGIMAHHTDYVTALGMGEARLTLPDGTVRRAACIGGMLSVLAGKVTVVATTWEWADEIDKARAEASRARAEELLSRKDLDARELALAQARLKRALVRSSVAG